MKSQATTAFPLRYVRALLRFRLRALATVLVVLAASVGLFAAWRLTTVQAAPSPIGTSTSWPIFNFDPARSGFNSNEQLVGPANIGQLTVLWSTKLPAVADSTPIYQDGRLFLTMKNGGTIAVDALTGAHVWQTKPPVGPMYTTSSPALDPSGQWVYSYGLDGMVHKYATATGQESIDPVWPALVTNMPDVEKESSALNLADGKLYATTGGYPGDGGHYEGHLVVVDLATGTKTVFNTLCSNITVLLTSQSGQPNYCSYVQSGVWARGGSVVDPVTGNVFISTGNGNWNGSTNWGDSVIELSGDGTQLLDTYTPTDQQYLNSNDIDLGSSAPAMLPKQPTSATPLMAVQVGKDGQLRLLNRQNLSGKGKIGQQGGELQLIAAPGTCEVLTAPTVWTDSSQSTWLFVANACGVAGYKLVTDGAGKSTLVKQWQVSTAGTSPVVGNGVLYVARNGAVDARDPATGALLWSSSTTAAKIGNIHWESPIIADGMLFISDENANVTAFGLPIPRPFKIYLPEVF